MGRGFVVFFCLFFFLVKYGKFVADYSKKK